MSGATGRQPTHVATPSPSPTPSPGTNWTVRRLEVIQASPVLFREVTHGWGVEPFSIEVIRDDGEVITDRVLIKISNPGIALSITTEIAIAYRVILAG